MKGFTPLRDWVVFDIPRMDRTASGIIVPESAKIPLHNIVKVLAAGPKCEMVEEGQTVLIHPSSPPLVIEVDGKDYACVNEFQVVGIIG